ncbi:31 kDa ribonucleoprotein, chloroplastic-like [Physcomitrium patens]|uniref:RRM domain-containing protein n=1 Tax=Physcomitrium patens TaxID=3218 RepID=A0A2K1JQ71_PHYPA|nr:31 kDa ribonucleoprotein, chloroplastic-like [Physcomitrium patens]PNR43671.1 hypothetical protein PHYPA_016053 [Physcomitrium patens]
MATARMSVAVASARLAVVSARSETSSSRNGSVVSLGENRTRASISCSFSGFSAVRRNVVIVNSYAEGGSADVATDVADAPAAVEEAATPAPQVGTKLYIGNLPWQCDSAQLAGICQEFGSVELVEVIYDQESGRSRGFAFVTMATQEDAENVIERLDGHDVGGRPLKVSFPQSKQNRPSFPRGEGYQRSERAPRPAARDDPNKVFVGNLSWGVDNGALQELFSDYGKVVDARVVYDRESGRSRGFGFVTYSDVSEVDAAIDSLDGAEFDGRELRVNLAGNKPASKDY